MIVGRIHWRNKKNACSLDQLNSMAGKWEASGATVYSKDCHWRFNWLHLKTLAKLSSIHERKIRDSLGMNNSETKAECDQSIKVLNRDRGNIVNTNSWKPLFRKINMVRHTNTIKQILLRVRFNYIIYICICVEPQRNQLVGY